MLKENGKVKKHTIIRCPMCKERIDLDDAIDKGFIDEIAKIKICTCEFCEYQFQLK